MERFLDRMDAGKQLAQRLLKYQDKKDTVVVSIPRGGVVVGYTIALELHIPLEIVLIKKIGHPTNPEFAIGAVSLKGKTVEKHVNVSEAYIKSEVSRLRNLLEERHGQYFSGREQISLKGKTVILTDDGVATGNTMIASIDLIKQEKPKKIILAIPVALGDFVDRAEKMVDEVYCLIESYDMFAIGPFYLNFKQVDDEEVQEMIKRFNKISAIKNFRY